MNGIPFEFIFIFRLISHNNYTRLYVVSNSTNTGKILVIKTQERLAFHFIVRYTVGDFSLLTSILGSNPRTLLDFVLTHDIRHN